MIRLGDIVKGKVKFAFYKDNELWYKTEIGDFEFPVPINDTGTGVFMAEDKGILFMRWIRKYMEQQEKWREIGNE